MLTELGREVRWGGISPLLPRVYDTRVKYSSILNRGPNSNPRLCLTCGLTRPDPLIVGTEYLTRVPAKYSSISTRIAKPGGTEYFKKHPNVIYYFSYQVGMKRISTGTSQ